MRQRSSSSRKAVETNDLSVAVTWANVPNANITEGSITQHVAAIDHDQLLNFASNEHFTEASIDHTNIQSVGTNTHAQIDTHIAASAAHGVSGDVMGTTDSQTMTNKTLTDTTNKARHTKQCVIENPTNAEDATWFFTNRAITLTQVRAVLVGGTTPSITYQIMHNTDRSAAGNTVTTSAAVTNTTTGADATLDDATVPADSWVWLETTAQSGSPVEIAVFAEYTDD